MSYYTDARSDAAETVEHFLDEIVEQIIDKGEASDDLLNDYLGGDSYHHESHVDKYYNLSDAAELLHELREHEETDDGLWQGLAPRDAIGAQAAYTYGNAVYSMFRDLIKEINEAASDAMIGRTDEVDGWSVAACLDYCKANEIDADEFEGDLTDEQIDELRKTVADHPDKETIEKAINECCEQFA